MVFSKYDKTINIFIVVVIFSIEPNIVKTDNEDTANDVEYEDPWPEWEPKENK